MDQVMDLGVAFAEEMYKQGDGPEDEYTAGVYAYSMIAARIHVRELCVGSYRVMNRALREGFMPLLLAEEFERPAWESVLRTSSTWIAFDWTRRFNDNPIEREYIRKWAPVLQWVPEEYAEVAARMYEEVAEYADDDPKHMWQHAAGAVLRAATDGRIGIFEYEQGQNPDVPYESWGEATATMRSLMMADDFAGTEADMVREAHAAGA